MSEKTTMTVLKADGTSSTRDFNERPTYQQLKPTLTEILGEPPEHVSVLHDGAARDMFVGENSACRDLPLNMKATAIYRAAHLAHHPKDHPASLPAIFGTAILFSHRVWY